jgi:hypothetical protein
MPSPYGEGASRTHPTQSAPTNKKAPRDEGLL